MNPHRDCDITGCSVGPDALCPKRPPYVEYVVSTEDDGTEIWFCTNRAGPAFRHFPASHTYLSLVGEAFKMSPRRRDVRGTVAIASPLTIVGLERKQKASAAFKFMAEATFDLTTPDDEDFVKSLTIGTNAEQLTALRARRDELQMQVETLDNQIELLEAATAELLLAATEEKTA